jgi:hypothetical protein
MKGTVKLTVKTSALLPQPLRSVRSMSEPANSS